MLFLLTGDIQTGKTRWLQATVENLVGRGVCCMGVVSPGIWKETATQDKGIAYEKLGIEALLLPQNNTIPFAHRADIAEQLGQSSPEWASVRAGLFWVISDEAIACLNEHLLSLQLYETHAQPGLLVVDELGKLELEKNEGLTSACELLRQGPTPQYQHALIVVRESLVEIAHSSFESAWGGACCIFPNDEGKDLLLRGMKLRHDKGEVPLSPH